MLTQNLLKPTTNLARAKMDIFTIGLAGTVLEQTSPKLRALFGFKTRHADRTLDSTPHRFKNL